MTSPISSAAKAGDAPNKPSPGAGRIFAIATAETPKRDVDLFGPTTVRIDTKHTPESAGVPLLYLSAYVADPERLAQRLTAALAWLDDSQDEQPGRAGAVEPVAPPAPAYVLPLYVEDVDYAEVLPICEDHPATDWKAWSGAIVRRIELATTAHQVAALTDANALGLRLCPHRFRAPIGKAIHEAYEVTQDQAAAA